MSIFTGNLPEQSEVGRYEMNFINDQQNVFGGNVYYKSDTRVKGKFTGNTLWINIYGVCSVDGTPQ